MTDSPPTAEPPRAKRADDESPREGAPREGAPLDDEGAWLEHADELPARPRRRILAPLPVALLLALALAGGFIAGVLVQKGQGGSASGSGFPTLRGASSFGGGARLRGSGAGAGSPTIGNSGSGSTSGSGSAPTFGGPNAGGAGTGGGATIGEVAFVSKDTLYVTTTEGNTVKVTAAPGSKVTKTVEAHVKGIHPGEMVLVAGTTNANGSITASSIRAGEAGGFGGAALFGAGAGAGASGASGNAGSVGASGNAGGATGGGPALFGKE